MTFYFHPVLQGSSKRITFTHSLIYVATKITVIWDHKSRFRWLHVKEMTSHNLL